MVFTDVIQNMRLKLKGLLKERGQLVAKISARRDKFSPLDSDDELLESLERQIEDLEADISEAQTEEFEGD